MVKDDRKGCESSGGISIRLFLENAQRELEIVADEFAWMGYLTRESRTVMVGTYVTVLRYSA